MFIWWNCVVLCLFVCVVLKMYVMLFCSVGVNMYVMFSLLMLNVNVCVCGCVLVEKQWLLLSCVCVQVSVIVVVLSVIDLFVLNVCIELVFCSRQYIVFGLLYVKLLIQLFVLLSVVLSGWCRLRQLIENVIGVCVYVVVIVQLCFVEKLLVCLLKLNVLLNVRLLKLVLVNFIVLLKLNVVFRLLMLLRCELYGVVQLLFDMYVLSMLVYELYWWLRLSVLILFWCSLIYVCWLNVVLFCSVCLFVDRNCCLSVNIVLRLLLSGLVFWKLKWDGMRLLLFICQVWLLFVLLLVCVNCWFVEQMMLVFMVLYSVMFFEVCVCVCRQFSMVVVVVSCCLFFMFCFFVIIDLQCELMVFLIWVIGFYLVKILDFYCKLVNGGGCDL